jgi:exosortase/archaeosortase family protein
MPEPDTHPEDRPVDRREDYFSLLVVLALTVIAYAPMVASVIRLGARTTQGVNAFLLLGFTFVNALITAWREHRFHPAINPHGLVLFSLSWLALVAAVGLSVWPLAVLGLCLNLGALLSFCFGRRGVTPFYPVLAGLGLAVGLLVFVPQLDRGLRTVAAHCSSWLLTWMGIQTDILFKTVPFQIVLVAEKGAGVFDVASECNGFGIILSSLVLTLVLALGRHYGWLLTAGLLGLALGLGLVFNTVRIVAIVMTALQTDLDYGLIHEGLGTLVYLGALIAIYGAIVFARPGRSSTSPR